MDREELKMNEKFIQKRLRKLTLFVAFISLVILLIGGLVSAALGRVLEESTETQMKSEVGQYKTYIFHQFDADFQTLHTLESFFDFSDSMDTDTFAQKLYESNNQNHFIRMGFYSTSGTGIRATLNHSVELDIPVDTLPEVLQEIIQKAWDGEDAVSRIFYDETLQETVYAYSIPVYADNGQVAGALLASDSIEIFSDILNDQSALNGQGYIHMIGGNGDFLVRSESRAIKKDVKNIYEGTYFTEKEKTRLKSAISQESSCFSSFQYNGEDYKVFLDPVGINGWYLFCVNTTQQLNSTFYQIVLTTRMVFFGILLLIVLLVFYGYRILRQSNRQLRQIAYHDTLTGANNLAGFTQKVRDSLEKTKECSVVSMNIRQFKFINEIFGRDRADDLLRHMNQILRQNLSEREYYCRDSGDSFLLYLLETDHTRIQQRLDSIMNQISLYSLNTRHNYQILLYCGVAVRTGEESKDHTCEDLITHSIFALHTAKGNHQNSIWFYNLDLHKQEQLENYVESHMNQALKTQEFRLFLQPKFYLDSGNLEGAEALVRWMTQEGETIFPDQFIPLFEKNGFCARLDLYMADQVCRQIREWIDSGIQPVPVSINQSKLLFYESDYVENLCKITEKYQIPPSLITLEILEGLALENVEELNTRIAQLQEKGFHISLDDFGSGYSTLNTLGSLHIDELKLDRGFLSELSLTHNDSQRVIIEEIISLTKKLYISTVAEGIETLESAELLKSMGCDLGQGYYYSRPLPAKEFTEKFLCPKSQKEPS